MNKVCQFAAVCAAIIIDSHGQQSAHYPAGVEGLKAGSLPPPGLYFREYTILYHGEDLRDGAGRKAPFDFDLKAFAFAPRLIWITDTKFLGGDVGVDIVLPFQYVIVKAPQIGVDDDRFGLGDILVDGGLVWHGKHYDATAGAGLWAPTGEFDRNRPASIGKGFWSGMLTLGGTYFPEEKRDWAFSVLNRFEFHSRNDDLAVRPGHHWTSEFGISKHVHPLVEIGVAGSFQQQLSDDSGPGVFYDASVHDRTVALGPEILVLVPGWKTFISLRHEFEFSVRDRPSGTFTSLVVSIKL